MSISRVEYFDFESEAIRAVLSELDVGIVDNSPEPDDDEECMSSISSFLIFCKDRQIAERVKTALPATDYYNQKGETGIIILCTDTLPDILGDIDI